MIIRLVEVKQFPDQFLKDRKFTYYKCTVYNQNNNTIVWVSGAVEKGGRSGRGQDRDTLIEQSWFS